MVCKHLSAGKTQNENLILSMETITAKRNHLVSGTPHVTCALLPLGLWAAHLDTHGQ